MNKETGEPVLYKGKEVAAEKKFKAEMPDGTVTLTFKIDSSLLEGQTVVAFEDLYHDDILLVSHADITDEDQSVHYPKIGTQASVAGSKTVVADTYVTLTDIVTYENLVPGEKYSLQGILMDQSTGKELVVNGNTVKASADFTAEGTSGQVEMTFSFDAENLGGHSVVVFEKLYHNGKEAAVHEDISDEGQTVTFTSPPTITHNPPKTGDPNTTVPFAVAAAVSAAGIAAIAVYRKKRKSM